MKDCWKILSVSLLLASVFWFTGMNIYLGNLFMYSFTFIQLNIVLGILSALIVIFLGGGLFLLRKKSFFPSLLLFFLGLGICLWFQSNIFVLGTKHWLYGILDILSYILILGAIFYFRSFFQKNIIKISFIFILAPTIPLISAYSHYDKEVYTKFPFSLGWDCTQEEALTFSENTNVILIILDSFGQGFFQDYLLLHPESYVTFKDFTSFSHCMSLYPKTCAAIPILLTGSDFYDQLNLWNDSLNVYEQITICHRPTYFSEIYAMFEKSPNVLSKELKRNHYLCQIFRTESSSIPKISGFDYSSANKDKEMLKKYFSPNILACGIVQTTVYRLSPTFWKDYFLKITEFWQSVLYTFYCGDSLNEFLTERMSPKETSETSLNQLLEQEPFFQNLPEISSLQKQNKFLLYHFIGTHDHQELPSEYDRNRYLQKGKMDLDGVAKFLELLKKSGVYDNSYIVVMGDHGGHFEPVLERKNPFFLVKRPGDTHEKMVTNEQPIFLRDIAPTILKDLGIVTEESYSFWNLSPEQKVERKRCWERISHNTQ